MPDNGSEKQPAKPKKTRKHGCLFKFFMFVVFILLICAVALAGWYAYLKFVADDPSVKGAGIADFGLVKLKWAGGQFAELYVVVKKAVAGSGENAVPEGGTGETTAEGTGVETQTGGTGVATIKKGPETEYQKMREEAVRATQRGSDLYQKAANADWRKDYLDRAELELRRAIDIYNQLKKQHPGDNSMESELQDINQLLYDISKQKRLK